MTKSTHTLPLLSPVEWTIYRVAHVEAMRSALTSIAAIPCPRADRMARRGCGDDPCPSCRAARALEPPPVPPPKAKAKRWQETDLR